MQPGDAPKAEAKPVAMADIGAAEKHETDVCPLCGSNASGKKFVIARRGQLPTGAVKVEKP
jgi:hypothetical protein